MAAVHTRQFVCMRESVGGRYNPQNVYNMTPTQEHYDIVDWAMAGGRLLGIDNSLFFFNPYSGTCPTYFPTNVGVIHNRIGDHCFYIPTSRYADT
ncbi:MAG: cell wall hydrolase [Anaerovoracaceae bacterium]|nr:cell wall hydrolase [Anaerovoracaceae bacterium]